MLKRRTTGKGRSMVKRSATTTRQPPISVIVSSLKQWAFAGMGYVQYADTGLVCVSGDMMRERV